MSILVSLHHVTRYQYDRPVGLGPQVVRLRPAPHCRTRVPSYSLKVTPAKHFVNWQQDPHGNWLARFVFPEKTTRILGRGRSAGRHRGHQSVRFLRRALCREISVRLSGRVARGARALSRDGAGRAAALAHCSPRSRASRATPSISWSSSISACSSEIRYLIRMEPGVQTPEETLAARRPARAATRPGCWCRSCAISASPARFVSGYLIQLQPDVKALDGPAGAEQDFTDLHAWTEVYLPGAGWIGLDSDLRPAVRRRPYAARRDAALSLGGADQRARSSRPRSTFSFEMNDRRASPRSRASRCRSPMKPGPRSMRSAKRSIAISRAQRRAPHHGRRADLRVDRRLPVGRMEHGGARPDQAHPRRRTRAPPARPFRAGRAAALRPGQMVSRRAAAALGVRALLAPRRRADLAQCRADRARRRATHTAVGRRRAARSREGVADAPRHHAGARAAGLRGSGRAHAQGRRAAGQCRSGRSEDRRSARARAHHARDSSGSSRPPAGYVLPVQRWTAQASAAAGSAKCGSCAAAGCSSCRAIRRSAFACRSIRCRMWPPADYPHLVPADPFAPSAPIAGPRRVLGGRAGSPAWRAIAGAAPLVTGGAPMPATAARPSTVRRARRHAGAHRARGRAARRTAVRVHAAGRAARGLSRAARRRRGDRGRACAAGPRGRLRAAARSAPQRDQGDARSRRDRGQHPSGGVLARGGRRSRSSALRGSASVAARHRQVHDRRPPHRHRRRQSRRARRARAPPTARSCAGPICSRAWCSTGSAIRRCPTCSPACSSARPARRRASTRRGRTCSTSSRSRSRRCRRPATASAPPPWLVDRLFRNLLVDVTGNTHRTEICIDKLFSPDGPTGRLGLVEFRSFEMPPDARMSLAQQLLLRALVAWFWREPLDGRWCAGARRCTTGSCWSISSGRISSTCSTISRRAGYRFDPVWFEAQREFRFPFYGAVDHGGVRLELRHALEPWHVLGEEGVAGGTARFVDSSVERLQVKVEGLNAARHIVTCNGRRVPLDRHRPGRRIRRRRALQGLEAAVRAASDHRGARAAHLRHHRHLEPPLARRLRLPCGASGRPQLRDLSGQLLRGRGAAARALPGSRPYAGGLFNHPARGALASNIRRPSTCGARLRPDSAMAAQSRQRRARTADALEPLAGGLSAAARHLRRDDGCATGAVRAHWQPFLRHARRARRRRDRPAIRRRRPPSARVRRVLPRLRGSGRRRAALAAEPRAAPHRRRRNGTRSRPGWSSAPSCSKRCWRTPTGRRSWSREGRLPAALIAGNPEFLRPLVGVAPAGRRAPALLRGRCRPRRRRPLVGAGRPHAGAVRRRLCAGEPARAVARHARHLPGAAGRAARAVLPGDPGASSPASTARTIRASACSRPGR